VDAEQLAPERVGELFRIHGNILSATGVVPSC